MHKIVVSSGYASCLVVTESLVQPQVGMAAFAGEQTNGGDFILKVSFGYEQQCST
jgi:hypothetical protein